MEAKTGRQVISFPRILVTFSSGSCQRSSSTSIKQLKEACEKFGYSFEYEIIAERLTGWTDQVKGLKIDYTAHYGNY